MTTFTTKKIALCTLAATGLALAACSNAEDGNTQPATQTVTETAAATENAQQTSEGAPAQETQGQQDNQSGNSATFDQAAIRTALEGAGYNCSGDDCTKEENGLRLDIDFDNDSVDTQIEALQDNAGVEAGYAAVLGDLKAAIGDLDFGGNSYADIRSWAESNAAERDARETFGDYEVHLENETDDGRPERSLDIEHVRS